MIGADESGSHRGGQSLAEADRHAVAVAHHPARLLLQVRARVEQPRAVHVDGQVVALAQR